MSRLSVSRFCAVLMILTAPGLCFGADSGDKHTAAATKRLASAPAPTRSRELVLLNWSDYLDPELIREFENKLGVEVSQVYYESDDTRDGILAESNGRGFDLVLVNGLRLQVYAKQGWLASITESDVPNLRHIDPRWRTAFAAQGYGVPFFWGTLGIGYRKDLVPEEIVSWKQFFEPSNALHGRIALIRNSRDVIGMALKRFGYSANTSDSQELAAAERLLMAQKPHVGTYTYVDLDEDSPLVTGEIVAAMMYSGDALVVQEHNENIVYVLPEEGGNLWVDYLVVMQASPNKKLAMAFIDFLSEPHNAARLAAYVYYATPNMAAERLMSKEFLADPTIYPSESQIANSEFYSDISMRALKKHNRIFSSLVQ